MAVREREREIEREGERLNIRKLGERALERKRLRESEREGWGGMGVWVGMNTTHVYARF